MDFHVRNDGIRLAGATLGTVNHHRGNRVGLRRHRERLARNRDVGLLGQTAGQLEPHHLRARANLHELAQVEAVLHVARAAVAHDKHQGAVRAERRERIAVVTIDNAGPRTDVAAECGVHVVARVRRKSLLAVVEREAAPVLGRVANLPVYPRFRMHVAQVLDNHVCHPERDMFVAALAKRARFGLPKALVQAEGAVEKLLAVAAVGITVRVHLPQVRERLRGVVAQLVVRLLDGRLVGSAHRRFREEPLLLERLAEFHDHPGLVVLEAAAFLPAV